MGQRVEHIKEEAIRKYQNGESAPSVANQLGIGKHNIYRWLSATRLARRNEIPKDIKKEIIRMYEEDRMLPREISNRLDVVLDSVQWTIRQAGIRRTKSEGMSISVQKRRKHSKGGMWHSSKTGKWEPAASIMEMLRMQQLDNDPYVETWTKSVPLVPYGEGRTYIPDIYVKYLNGREVVEEIKPSSQHCYPENKAKWEAANSFLGKMGIDFVIVSEQQLGGSKALREFDLSGLQQPDKEKKRNREKARYNAWRLKNKEKLEEQRKNRYALNKQKCLEYIAEYNKANREEINRKQREYNARNRESINEKQRQYERNKKVVALILAIIILRTRL